jgi:uncharacterized protein (TIGR03083 family)
MSDHAEAYRALHDRVVALVGGLDEAALAPLVPATPEWSVHDVVAHLVGVTSDVVAGRVEGAGTDPWTAVQVGDRLDASLAELLAEWEGNLEPLGAIVDALPPEITGQIVFDAATHEHDLRHALGEPGEQASDAVGVAYWWICQASAGRVAEALTVETEVGRIAFGSGAPVTRLRAPRFEVLRAVTGRRSLAQIAAFDWDPEPRPDLLVVSPPFTARADDLVESTS